MKQIKKIYIFAETGIEIKVELGIILCNLLYLGTHLTLS